MNNKTSEKKRGGGHARMTSGIKKSSSRSIVECTAWGAGVGSALCLLLILLASFIICQTADPLKYITVGGFCVLYLSSFFGGFTASKLRGGSALLCGLAVGCVFLVLTLLVSFLLDTSVSSGYDIFGQLSLRTAIPICTIAGAFVGIIKKSSNKGKRKKHNKR